MVIFNKWWAVLAGPLLFFCCACHRADPLQAYLGEAFPDWQVVDTSDYSPVWWSFYERDRVPYRVAVDINDDEALDHALLMKKNNELRLVFVFKGDVYRHVVAPDVGGMATDMTLGLAVEPPAQIDVVTDKPTTLLLESNGVVLMDLEEKVRVYYWKEGRLASFRMK